MNQQLFYSDPDKPNDMNRHLLELVGYNVKEVEIKVDWTPKEFLKLHVNMPDESLKNGIKWMLRKEQFEQAAILQKILDFRASDEQETTIMGLGVKKIKDNNNVE